MIRVLLIRLNMFISQEHSHSLFTPMSCGLLSGVVGGWCGCGRRWMELANLDERMEMIGKAARAAIVAIAKGVVRRK